MILNLASTSLCIVAVLSSIGEGSGISSIIEKDWNEFNFIMVLRLRVAAAQEMRTGYFIAFTFLLAGMI